MNMLTHPAAIKTVRPSFLHIVRGIGRALLRLLTALVIVLLAVPVALLPVSTSVPALIWVLLTIADIALVVTLVRFARTWRAAIGTLAGFVVVAALAVVASQS